MPVIKQEPSSPGPTIAQIQARGVDVKKTGNISGLRYVTYGYEDYEPRVGVVGGILQLDGIWFGLTVLTPFLEDTDCSSDTKPFWHSAPNEVDFKSAEIYDAREPHILWGRIPPDPQTLQPLERYFSRGGNWALVELINQELAETCLPGPEASWLLLPMIMDKDKAVPHWQLMIPGWVLPQSEEPLLVVEPRMHSPDTSRRNYYYGFKSGGCLAAPGAWVVEEAYMSVVGIVHDSYGPAILTTPAWWTFHELLQRFPGLKSPLICCGFPIDSGFLGSRYKIENISVKREDSPSV